MKAWIILGTIILLIASTGCQPVRPRGDYNVPVAQLEQSFGRLVTVPNMPTPDQNGTGDRLGLFRDDSGTFWEIPLTIAEIGTLLFLGFTVWMAFYSYRNAESEQAQNRQAENSGSPKSAQRQQ